jgi:hypothetical protein
VKEGRKEGRRKEGKQARKRILLMFRSKLANNHMVMVV